MHKLRLDLGELEVERLDVAAVGLNGGLETFGMGHGSTDFGQSCTTCNPPDQACTDEFCDASCTESACECNTA